MGDWGGQQGGGYQQDGYGGGGGYNHGGGGYGGSWGGGGGGNSYGGSWGGGGGGYRSRGGDVRPGDWQCPAGCGNVFASKMNCFRCGMPKPEGTGGDQVRGPEVPRHAPKTTIRRIFSFFPGVAKTSPHPLAPLPQRLTPHSYALVYAPRAAVSAAAATAAAGVAADAATTALEAPLPVPATGTAPRDAASSSRPR